MMLIILACLIDEPYRCEVFSFETGGTLLECMVSSQYQLARWSADHPAYRITKFHCGRPEARL